jgi:hypothetical protein
LIDPISIFPAAAPPLALAASRPRNIEKVPDFIKVVSVKKLCQGLD